MVDLREQAMKTTTCYLLCFDKPIGNLDSANGWAGHYLGSSAGLDAELARFRRNGGHAKIMQELYRQGIGFDLVRTWPGGRSREKQLKGTDHRAGRGRGLRRYCPRCSRPSRWQRGDTMYGGYAVVAGVINQRFRPEPPVSRSRVYHWHKRGTLNRAGDKPPSPVEENPDAPRTQPRYVFDTDPWLEWFRHGVPGPHGRGWVAWALDQDEKKN